jgi:hypothetical protein
MEKSNDVIMEKMIIDLKQFTQEKDRLIEVCKNMIEHYQMTINAYESEKQIKYDYVLNQISTLMENVKMKETATQYSYNLPSGKIIKKKSLQSIKLDKGADKTKIPEEYLKHETSINWAELKKNLTIVDNEIYNKDTGEKVDYCIIENTGEELKLKI